MYNFYSICIVDEKRRKKNPNVVKRKLSDALNNEIRFHDSDFRRTGSFESFFASRLSSRYTFEKNLSKYFDFRVSFRATIKIYLSKTTNLLYYNHVYKYLQVGAL